MKPGQIQYWRRAIETAKLARKKDHETWRRLLKAYGLEFEGINTGNAELKKISRFYPLTRQIMASVTFKYPELFFHVEEQADEYATDILERTANAAIEQMNVMPEVRQATFDSLYCYIGWIKYGYNPPGDDASPPYIANDAMADDMPYVRRVSPFNIYPDPNCPPQDIAYAEYIIEEMMVPLEFLKNDPRYENVNNIKPVSAKDADDDEFATDFASEDQETREAQAEAIEHRQMVRLWEIHDRTHRRRITFAEGVEQPIEDIPHPFLETEEEMELDPTTGEEIPTGNFKNKSAFLVNHGFPYSALRFDMPGQSLYGLPPMAYVEDAQAVQIESVSRRLNLLKRNGRMLLGNRREQERNKVFEEQVANGDDNAVAWVEDINNAFREMPQNNVQPDQLGIEADMRQYEEQTLQVSQMAMGGGSVRTATESSLIAGFGQLNREWIQAAISKVYEDIARNTLRIMADERYTPEAFLVNMAQNTRDPVYQAVSADMLKVKFRVTIIPGSMQPLTEQLEKEDTLAFANYMIRLPEVNREEVVRTVARAFRVPDIDKFVGTAYQEEALRAAQLENQLMIMSVLQGQPTPQQVLPHQNHNLHASGHQGIQQDPLFQQQPPEIQQVILQVVQAHLTQHQQILQQQAMGAQAAGGAGAGEGGNINSIGDQAGIGANPMQAAGRAISETRGNAQKISQAVATNPGQN